jgi:hypothetical protein
MCARGSGRHLPRLPSLAGDRPTKLSAHEIEINAGLVLEAMDIRVGGASYATAAAIGLHKTNPGW